MSGAYDRYIKKHENDSKQEKTQQKTQQKAQNKSNENLSTYERFQKSNPDYDYDTGIAYYNSESFQRKQKKQQEQNAQQNTQVEKQTVNNTQKYTQSQTGGRKTTATITPTRNRLENDILANISRKSTSSLEPLSGKLEKYTPKSGLKREETNQYRKEQGRNNEDSDIEKRYESLPNYSLPETLFDKNKRAVYNEKQALYPEYRKIKNDKAVEDLLRNGFTEEDIRSVNRDVLTQKDIEDLVAQGKSDEEIEKIAEDLFTRGERTRQRLYDYSMDQRKNSAGLSYQDYVNAMTDYYANPEVKGLAKRNPGKASFETFFTKPGESIYNVGVNAYNYLTGRPIENHQISSDVMREGATERIDNKLGQMAYGGVMSIGDMAVAQGIDFALGGHGNISAAIQAIEKASQVINEGVDKGLTPNKIAATSLASAVTTFLTEKISMGMLSDIAEKGLTKYTAKEIAEKLAASFHTEGSQEVFEELADYATNSILSWDKNDFKQSYEEYRTEGNSELASGFLVLKDSFLELLSDYVFGGLGALGIGSANIAIAKNAGKVQTNPHVDTNAVMQSNEALNQLVEAVKSLDTTNLSEEDVERVEHAKEVAEKPIDEMKVEDVVDMSNVLNEQANEENRISETIQEINYQAAYENNISEYRETGTIQQKENELPIETAAREEAEKNVKQFEKLIELQKKKAEKQVNLAVKGFNQNIQQNIQSEIQEPMQQITDASEGFESETAAKNFIENYNGQNIELYTKTSYLAYRAGESGQDFNTFMKNSPEARLMVDRNVVSEDYLKTLFYNGQNNRIIDAPRMSVLKNENRGKVTGIKGDLNDLQEGVARKLNVEIYNDPEEVDSRGKFLGNVARIIIADTADNKYQTLIHEMFEFAREYNPKGMELAERTLVNMIVAKSGETKFINAVNTYREAYKDAAEKAKKKNPYSDLVSEANKTNVDAQEEFINDAISYIYSTDDGAKVLVDYLMGDESTTAEEKVTILESIKQWVDHLIQTIKNYLSGHPTEQLGYRYVEKLKLKSDELKNFSQMLVGALEGARANLASITEQGEANSKQEGGESEKVAHQVKVPANETLKDKIKRESDSFEKQLDAWDGVDERKHFVVGTTSEILNKEIGVPNAEIKMDSSKIVKVFKDHPEMKNLLHRIPEILNDPIIIMESRTVADAYVLYGDVFNGKDPVMVSLLIYPKGRNGIALDIHKVSSAYAKDNAQYQLNHSVVKYISPDKKRTAAWNRLTRLQLPFAPTISSSTNNVPQNQPNSKTQSGKTRNSLAVHAGDLGKSEGFWQMTSSNRGTGHFGTGTYFVGDEEQINNYGYEKRPHEKVDFANYNLFTPKTYKQAMDLHESLKFINNNVYSYDILNRLDSLDSDLKDIDKYGYDLFKEENVEKATEELNRLYEIYGKYMSRYDRNRLGDREDYKNEADFLMNFSDYIDSIREGVEDYVEKYEDSVKKLADVLGVSEDTVKDTMMDVFDESAKITDAYKARYEDSPSTRFMKRLGYEGVDVRDIKQMDNVEYGSVIYDLKGEDLKRKQEIGTAKYSLKVTEDSEGRELSEGQQEYFKDSVVRDDQGCLMVMYHGTPNGDFTVFRGGSYFTNMAWYADRYQNQGASSLGYKKTAKNPKTYAAYLNITKPFDTRDPEIRKIWDEQYYQKWDTGDITENGLPDWTAAEGLREFIEENGLDFDGLIIDEGGVPTDDGVLSRGFAWVPLNGGNQVKDINNLNPTPNKDMRFSLDVPVEETDDLIAVHNLYDEKLKGILELGGFPMPSIAITKADMAHEKFGNISVLFRRDTIDPKKSKANKVYSGDAYTPTFPRIGYKVNDKKVHEIYDRLQKILGDEMDAFGYLGIDSDNITDYLERNNGDAVEAYYNKEALQYAYAKDKGLKFDAPTKEARLSWNFENEEIKYIALMFTPEEALRIYQNASESYREFKEDGRLQKILDKINAVEKKSLGKFYDNHKTTEISFADFDNLMNSIVKYKREGIKEEIDRAAFSKEIKNILVDREESYRKWLEDLFDGVISQKGIRNNKDTFTPSGSRRSWDSLHDEYNLTNIVKAMKGEPEVGQSLGGYTLLGSINRQFDSIEDIHSEENRLQFMDDDEYSKLRGEIQDDLYEVAKKLVPNPGYDVLSICGDIAEAAAKRKTRSGIKSFLSEWYDVSEEDMDEIMRIIRNAKELPTGYFEAKPQRAVGFDEVAAVVIPSDDEEMIRLCEEKGLPVVTYERGDKESRLKAVNSVENIKFSLKVTEDSEGKTLSEGQQAFFKDSKIRDKEGRLLRLYHGSMANFTVFDIGEARDSEDIEAFFFSPNAEEAEGYGNTREFYLNITNPADFDTAYNIFFKHRKENPAGAGARAREELISLGYDGVAAIDQSDPEYPEYLAFYPEQIKLVSNVKPTKNEDVRYSIDVSDDGFFDSFLEIDEEVKKTESALKEMIDKKMDLDSDISKKMISDVASYIKNKYNSTYKKEWLESSITAIFKFLQNNNVRMEDIMYIMSDIAKPILENVKNADPEQEKLYKDVVNTVKSYKIKLDAGQKQEVINAYGSYKNFVDSMRGKITLSNDGIALDNIWTELVDKTGGGLSYGTVPNDQPIELANLINSLNPTYASLEGQALEDAAMDVSLDIISQFYVHNSMTEAAKAVKGELTKRANKFKEDYKKRYNEALKQVEAEKALNIKRLADEIDNLTAEEQEAIRTGDTVNQVLIENLKKEYKARYERLQAQANEKIARARANYQNSWINKNLRRERSELKNRVLREVKALQNMIAHPQEGASKHVPINLIKPTIEMLEAINLDNGGRNKAIAERLKKMSEVYESFKNDDTYSFDYDERIASDIKELQEMFNNKSYADLGITELQRVIEIVTALKTQIKNANNLILQGKLQDAKQMATEAVNEVREGKRTSNLASDRLNKYLNAHLNAKREFRKLAGYVDGAIMKIYNDIEQGFLKETTIQRDLGAIFQGVLEGKENQREIKRFISAKENDLVDLGITDESGKPIKITRAMRMSLIMHSMNASNMRHVLGSGIKIPDMKLFAQGKIAEAYAKGETVRFVDYNAFLEAVQRNDQNKINELTTKAQERIENLKNDLSEWEKRYLAASEKMFHEETGKLINETSMAVKGYALARVKNYFPIRTDSDFSKKDWAGLAHDGSIEGMGMLKERVISSKPILLEDITNVTLRQIENVSKYAGYALPMRNFNMVMNTTLDRRNTNGKLVNLLSTIGKEWGKTDTDYLTDLMQDIQGARGESKSFLTSLRGQFAGATLTLNPSVALSQAASYPTAGAVVGFKPLMKAMKDMGKGFVTKKGIEELERINPLLWYRNQGNATQDLKDARNAKLPVVLQKGINWIEFMDTGTVRTLEYASMYYVDENYKNLEKGSEEYWQKVSEVFTRVVTETQPNYSTLHRPSILRTPNSLVKMLTMFKTQALQNFNIVYDALGELNAAKKSDDKDWQKRAAGNFANAVSSQTTALVVFSAIKMLSQLMFHRWNKYRDEDDEWSWEMFLKAFGWQMASTFAGSFLFGSEIFDWIKAKVTKDRYYGIEVSTVEMANDLLSNIRSASDYAEKLGDAKTEEDRVTNFKNLMKYVYNIGTTIGEFTGVPVNNIKNMLSSIFFYGADIKEGIESGDFEISNDSDLVKYLTGGDTPTQYERLYEAFENGDTKKYDKLVEELVNKSLAENKEEIKAGEMTADDIAQAVQDDVTNKILKLMKADYLEGNVSKEELTDFLVNENGKTEDDAYIQIKKWEGGTSSEYKVMNDSVSIAAADPTPENRQKVIDEVKGLVEHGKTPKGVYDSLSRAYKEQFIELYNEGKAADLNSILRAALVAAGFTDEEAKEKLEGWLK